MTKCSCGEETLILCEECGEPTCWKHRHNYGTHHAPAFAIGERFQWGRHGTLEITDMYADRHRWKYDGMVHRLRRSIFACGIWESDLLQKAVPLEEIHA